MRSMLAGATYVFGIGAIVFVLVSIMITILEKLEVSFAFTATTGWSVATVMLISFIVSEIIFRLHVEAG